MAIFVLSARLSAAREVELATGLALPDFRA
jgi:hypothetical protein